MKMKKLVSWFAALCMLVALIPNTALAVVTTGIPSGWSITGGEMETVYDDYLGSYVLKITKDANATATLTYALSDTVEADYEFLVSAKLEGDAKAGVPSDMVDLEIWEDDYSDTYGTVAAKAGDDFVIEFIGGEVAYLFDAMFGAAAGVEYLGDEWMVDTVVDTRNGTTARPSQVGNGGSLYMDVVYDSTLERNVMKYTPRNNGNNWWEGNPTGGFMCFEPADEDHIIEAGVWQYEIKYRTEANLGDLYIGTRFTDSDDPEDPTTYEEMVLLASSSSSDGEWTVSTGTITAANSIWNNFMIATKPGTGNVTGSSIYVSDVSFKPVLISEGGANMLNCVFEQAITLESDEDPGTTDGWSVNGGSMEIVQVETEDGVKPVLKVTKTADATATITYDMEGLVADDYFVTVTAKGEATATAGVTGATTVALTTGSSFVKTEGTATAAADGADLVIEFTEGTELYISEATLCTSGEEYLGEELLAVPNIDTIDDLLIGDVNDTMLKTNNELGWGWTSTNGQPTQLIKTTVNGVERKAIQFFPISNKSWGSAVVAGDLIQELEAGTYEAKILGNTVGNPGGVFWGMRSDVEGGMDSYNSASDNYFGGQDGDFVWRTARFKVDAGENSIAVYSDNWGETTGEILIAEASVKQVFTTNGPNLVENNDFRAYPLSTYNWSCSRGSMKVVPQFIDGYVKNVLELYPIYGSGAHAEARIGTLPEGNYRLSVWTSTPGNPGTTIMGLSAGFPDSGQAMNVSANDSTYMLTTLDVYNGNTSDNLTLNMWFEYGDSATISLFDASIQRIYDDGTLGENLLLNPKFQIDELDESADLVDTTPAESWSTTGTGKGNNFAIREVVGMDGTTTKALVGYRSPGYTGMLEAKQDVITEYDATYVLSFKAKTEGAITYADTRMGAWMGTDADGLAVQNDYWVGRTFATGATDWTEYKVYYTMPSNAEGTETTFANEIGFTMAKDAETFSDPQKMTIDDVSFCKVLVADDAATEGVNEEVLGDNIIANGDFSILSADAYNLRFAVVANGETLYEGTDAYIPDDGSELVARVTFANGYDTPVTPIFAVAVYENGHILSVDWVNNISIAGGKSQDVEWKVTLPAPEDMDLAAEYTAKAFVWDADFTAYVSDVEVIY